MSKTVDFAVSQTNGHGPSWRAPCFLLSTSLLALAFWRPLATLISLGFGAGHDADQYSQVAVIPLVCLYLLARKRKSIFANARWSVLPGISLILFGFLFSAIAKQAQGKLGQHDYLSALMASFVVLMIGNFVLLVGTKAFKLARFPLLMLLLMIPFPGWFLDRTVSFLQEGSAAVTAMLLNLTGLPFVREGLVFHLPTSLNIFIAYDCSGIRSSIALLIASLVASDVFLSKSWTKLALNLAVLPLSLFKNGLRIATLSLLTIYVNRGFISGDLHRDGGIVFYLIACLVLGLLLWRLRKLEHPSVLVRRPIKGDQKTGLDPAEASFKKQTI